MIEALDYQSFGIAGIFIAYLIYDRQVIIKNLIKSIDKLGNNIEMLIKEIHK